MIKFKLLVLFILMIGVFIQCNSSNIKQSKSTVESLSTLPIDEFSEIVKQVNTGEIIFYGDTPFSLTIDRNACKSYFKSMVNLPVEDPNCAPAIGRIFFNSEMTSVVDAEVYLSDECAYLLFFWKDNKYANPIQGEIPLMLKKMLDPKNRPTIPN